MFLKFKIYREFWIAIDQKSYNWAPPDNDLLADYLADGESIFPLIPLFMPQVSRMYKIWNEVSIDIIWYVILIDKMPIDVSQTFSNYFNLSCWHLCVKLLICWAFQA